MTGVEEELEKRFREMLGANSDLRVLVAQLRTEKVGLVAENYNLRSEVESIRRERFDLHQKISDLEHEAASQENQVKNAKEEVATLATLFAASTQLAKTFERRSVLRAIQEITARLLGSEEIGVYEISADGERLELAWAFGIDPTQQTSVLLGEGTIGAAAADGKIFIEPTPAPHRLSVCIPLTAGDSPVGAITVYGVPHAPERPQRFLYSFLSVHAAAALYSATRGGQGLRLSS